MSEKETKIETFDAPGWLERLRRIIGDKDLSVTRLARAAGVHRTTIHGILEGRHRPSLETVDKLTKALNGLETEMDRRRAARRATRAAGKGPGHGE